MADRKKTDRSLGCLFAGIGVLLLGIAAVIAVTRLTAALRSPLSLFGSSAAFPSGDATGRVARWSATNAAPPIVSLLTNAMAVVRAGPGATGEMSDEQLEKMQNDLLSEGLDPEQMAEDLKGALSDPAFQKQLYDFVNSDAFRKQMQELLELAPSASNPGAASTNRL